MKGYIFTAIAILALQACSDGKKEAELQEKIAQLETQLDECQNGSDKLFAKIKLAFDSKDYSAVKSVYSEFKERHPDAAEFADAKSLFEQVELIEKNQQEEAQRKAEEEKAEKLKALNKLKKDFDDVSGITWYKQPYFTHYTNTNLTSIYMGDNGQTPWLRLMMSYNGDDWIFFEKAYLSYEGNTIEIPFNKYENKKTENDGGGVWEWIDLSVAKDVELFLRGFANSKEAKMRLTGKYEKTRKLTRNERQGILDVLNGYEVLLDQKK